MIIYITSNAYNTQLTYFDEIILIEYWWLMNKHYIDVYEDKVMELGTHWSLQTMCKTFVKIVYFYCNQYAAQDTGQSVFKIFQFDGLQID